MMEGSGAESVPLTNGSGYGRPKNLDPDPELWLKGEPSFYEFFLFSQSFEIQAWPYSVSCSSPYPKKDFKKSD